ncbi:MAG: adenylate/guanylate cyclase domain-containing protein [Nitrospirae bacterium]|nr:adenylate/guanylate cyclase domain-containing protein [Nitrospirota bacterium]
MKLHRFVIFTAIGFASAALIIFIYSRKIDFFNAVDLKLKDVRLKTRGTAVPDKRVIIAAIDGKSINELGRWPWDRKIIARLVENLKLYGAKTIALDIVFSEPSNPGSDKQLADAFRSSGSVVGGYFFREETEQSDSGSLSALEQSRIKILKIRDNATDVPIAGYSSVELNIPEIAQSAVSAGFFNIIQDSDGILRSSNLLMIYDGNVYPSLALSALRHYLGSEIILEAAQYGVDNLLMGNHRMPVDESGKLTLNYYGKGGTFKTIPAVDIIKNRLKSGSLNDTVVFVGPTEIGLSDLRTTPVDPVLPGVEIHATVASNALQNSFIIRDGRVTMLDMAFIIIFALMLTTSLSFIKRTIIALALFLTVLGLYFSVNFMVFKNYLLNTSVLFPIASITMAYLCSEAYRNLIEEKHSRFLKKAFTSYVSPALVGEIMKNPDMLKLGGEKRNITVLFSDIRGFTTISEKLTPEALVHLLNQYLGPMTDIVLQHRGTLDKYIGDAIMALYNAPLDVEDHPLQACRSALVMMEKLKDLNVDFKANGLPAVDIGIGINTGDVIVGNMGTDVRFDYTAMGDTVNLSSRLEGMNKIYKTHIIFTEFTLDKLKTLGLLQQVSGEIRFRELDFIKVKGKDKPVTIYELSASMDEAVAEKFEEALGLYRKQSFNEAKEIFERLESENGDKSAGMFAERCAEFIDNPPGADWDGVYTAKTK